MDGIRNGGSGEERVVRSSGSHNCGGRCVLKLHVRDGRVVRISSDDDGPDSKDAPQLRACLRCRSYRERMYHPDRLMHPLKRVGKRGSGEYRRASWDEALDDIASSLKRVRSAHGADSIYMNYATGNAGLFSERSWMERLLGLSGGWLSYYGTYSTACGSVSTPYVYGTNDTGSSRETWLKSKLIVLWGFNPAETIFGTNTTYHLRLAKEAGARIVAVDPIYHATAGALADQWIPIKPTTDNALMDALAYVMVSEGLHDSAFLDRLCVGFDEAHMPEGAPPGASYESYLLGRGRDGLAKTPAWAEAITGVPRDTIVRFARDYAAAKPAALLQGYGPQRHACGEQFHRGGAVLAAMAGNVGVEGGWAAGLGYQARKEFVAALPRSNPNKAQISVFAWPDAIVRGRGMGPELGVRGGRRLESDLKFMFNLGGNCLVNQHADAAATARMLADESLLERIVASDHFLTPSAKYADWVLPSDCMYERDDIVKPWGWGDYVLFMNKAVDAPGECRNGYDWIGALADRLDLGDAFREGRTQEDWLRLVVQRTAERNPGFPSFEDFKEKGMHRWTYPAPDVAFRAQVEDPGKHPFPTPSGKIEIFSKALWDMGEPVPALPSYVPAWEGPADPLKERFPLQCLGHHTKRRVHSTFDNSPSMEETEPHALWINPEDAEARGLSDGDLAVLFNDRGRMELPAKLTLRLMPGVVSVPQGAWWAPGTDGVDRRGSINAVTRYKPTPLAFGNPTHTNLVQVEKAGRDA